MRKRGRAEDRARAWAWSPAQALLFACLVAGLLLAHVPAAQALKAIAIANDLDRIEITALGEAYEGRGDALQIETAPGADGVRGRMSVRAATPGTNPAWFVFALVNTTDKPIERWLAADRYGMVGSGRGDGLDSGSGDSLYAVNGQMPRNLDRNITLVGRVVQGMNILSTYPRGTEALGFYATAAERTPIRSVRVASDVPAGERTNLETLRTDSETWARLVDSRRTRRDSFFSANPVNRLSVCNVSVPVRAMR